MDTNYESGWELNRRCTDRQTDRQTDRDRQAHVYRLIPYRFHVRIPPA